VLGFLLEERQTLNFCCPLLIQDDPGRLSWRLFSPVLAPDRGPSQRDTAWTEHLLDRVASLDTLLKEEVKQELRLDQQQLEHRVHQEQQELEQRQLQGQQQLEKKLEQQLEHLRGLIDASRSIQVSALAHLVWRSKQHSSHMSARAAISRLWARIASG
jgi:hypothetical protein